MKTQSVILGLALLFGSWFLIFYCCYWADGNDLLTRMGEIAIGRAHWRDDWEETHLNTFQSPDLDGKAQGNAIQHGSVSRQATGGKIPSRTTDAPQTGDNTPSPIPATLMLPAEPENNTDETFQLACQTPSRKKV